jgi:hypothetical protein
MNSFDLPKFDTEVLLKAYKKSHNKICSLSSGEFLEGIIKRGAYEGDGGHTGHYVLEKGLFLVNGEWRSYPNCIEFFINDNTHKYIEKITGLKGTDGYFENLPQDYKEYRKIILTSFVERAIDFYKSHGNTFSPADWEDPETNDLANLRGPLEKYLLDNSQKL